MPGRELERTLIYTDVDSGALKIRRWQVRVISGPDAGLRATFDRGTLLVGSSDGNDLILSDPRVSRAHVELRLLEKGLHVRDLGSSNGTFQGGARVSELVLQGSSVLRLGSSEVALEPADEEVAIDRKQDQLGEMVGSSEAMRQLFGLIRQIAPTDVSLLVEGETGTGKELVAHEIHASSARGEKPLIVVDCGALPAGLVESELFGHVRGAFTGAVASREGAFVLADTGTIFLDEIGELPPDLQPKLLRVLEEGEVKRVGDSLTRKVDVRVIAATSRDLTREVSKGAFRPDLFYRLAVVRLRVPPLRERLEDLQPLVEALAARISGKRVIVPAAVVKRLGEHVWPGNVRELRNVVSHALAMRPKSKILELPEILGIETNDDEGGGEGLGFTGEVAEVGDYREAKRKAVDEFEMRYLTALLGRHGWNVSGAAREAGVDRNYLHRLIKRHEIKRPA